VTGGNQVVINLLTGVFICAGIWHGLFYITDKPTLRSLVWTVGFFSMIGLFLAAGASA